jgi:DNA-binding NarL/FixJ family response regulator
LRPTSARILVVDDFVLFRQLVRSILVGNPKLQIVGEASDGLEAVQKALELTPDLILMDIRLPSLSGIEAARQIRKLVPHSKIIFLGQESSAEVVQGVMNLGASGYVLKAYVGTDLLAAVKDVLLGKKFVSSG